MRENNMLNINRVDGGESILQSIGRGRQWNIVTSDILVKIQ